MSKVPAAWLPVYCVVAAGLVGFVVGYFVMQEAAQPAEIYPSVAQLQAALNAGPGARLPPQVIANGRVWTGYYVGAKEIGHGRYSIIIELR